MVKKTFGIGFSERAADAALAGLGGIAATVAVLSLPSPGEPGTVPLIAMAGLFGATAIGYVRGKRGPSLRATGFAGAYVGSAFGLLLYLFGLATGIY